MIRSIEQLEARSLLLSISFFILSSYRVEFKDRLTMTSRRRAGPNGCAGDDAQVHQFRTAESSWVRGDEILPEATAAHRPASEQSLASNVAFPRDLLETDEAMETDLMQNRILSCLREKTYSWRYTRRKSFIDTFSQCVHCLNVLGFGFAQWRLRFVWLCLQPSFLKG